MRKISYQQRIFLYFFIAFTLFTISILIFQYHREKQYKIDKLESRLEVISGFTKGFIEQSGMVERNDFSGLDRLAAMIPIDGVRITIIDPKGNIKYDSYVPNYPEMENHLLRPEIQKALYSERGSNIRHSETTGEDFYYYAANYDTYFVRCAVVYDLRIIGYLKTDRIFIFFMIAQFLIFGILLYIVTNRLGLIIKKLRNFAIRAGNNEVIDHSMDIRDAEFEDIQKQIVQIYASLKDARDELSAEKDRLSNHLLALNEGIAFFTFDRKKILTNSTFIQYLNLISDQSSVSAEFIFEIDELRGFISEIDEIIGSLKAISAKNLPLIKKTITKNEKYFRLQAIVFTDRSFEILISDITRPEKRRLLKQQLTSNIAHELKTPLASIKGYLETLLNNPELDKEKTAHFVRRSFSQAERLNELLNDISLLNNIEDASNLFEFQNIPILPIITDILENLEDRIQKKKIEIHVSVSPEVSVYGNDSLIASIFQNLLENSVNYGGEKIKIQIEQYLEDEAYYYFRYSDTGPGVSEEHLSRLFERFYRVDNGRSRDEGGTGLGLAIVKNAIQLHKGEVSVKNVNKGGLAFFFSLAKS